MSKVLSTTINILRYVFLASIIFIAGSQILLNLVPYNELVTQINQLGNKISDTVVTSLASGVTRIEDSNGNVTTIANSSESELTASAIAAFINIIVVSLVFLTSIAFLLSVVLTVLGMLFLSQSRNIFESIFLVVAFAIPRQRKHWGIVFDQGTNTPIPFASIRVLTKDVDNQLQQVTQSVADLDGRYRVYVEDKTKVYNLLISAPGYVDGGRMVEDLKTNEIIEDMALSKNAGATQNFHLWISKLRPMISNRVVNYLYFLSILATFLALYNLTLSRSNLDYVAVIIYGVGFIWNTLFLRDRRLHTPGRIIDDADDHPLESVFVRVMRGGKTLVSAVSDANGIVKFDLEPGTYLMEVNSPDYAVVSESLQGGNIDMVKITPQGYLSKNLLLRRTTEPRPQTAERESASSLMNPFS